MYLHLFRWEELRDLLQGELLEMLVEGIHVVKIVRKMENITSIVELLSFETNIIIA